MGGNWIFGLPVEVYGTGMTFELGLRELVYDWKEREQEEVQEMEEVCDKIMQRLQQVEQILNDTGEGYEKTD